jgi:hypothetical protein
MFMFARCSALALVALALSGWAAQAQVAPVPYANSNWFLGLGNSGLDGGEEAARNGMPTGWFMTGTRNNFNTSGFNRLGAFGGYNGLSSEGVQFGYALKNTPLSIYAGFDTLKYNAPTSAASTARLPPSIRNRPQRPAPSAPMRASSTGRRRISACRSASA